MWNFFIVWWNFTLDNITHSIALPLYVE
jgi:hypothetical protein